jgi:hypothetical protein
MFEILSHSDLMLRTFPDLENTFLSSSQAFLQDKKSSELFPMMPKICTEVAAHR